MRYEEMISEIYFTAGMLEGLSCMQGQLMTEAVTFMLRECVDRLKIVGTQLIGDSGTTLEIRGVPSAAQMHALLSKKKVIADAGRPTEAFGRVYQPEDASDQ